ncbi:MAG: chromate efflux transporter [Armatimonadetes bacterium]|nr:chromate efflux transporter [Armatimonadota bacterium]
MSPSPQPTEPPLLVALKELALLFLRLGAMSFGGPAAHIALMEEEVVRRREWMTREEFLDLLGAANLIPGPNSTEMAIHIGYLRARWLGLIVAGVCFITPAILIVMGLAWGYVRVGNIPQVNYLLYGVEPVIVVVIFQALWLLGRSALKSRLLVGVGLLSAALAFSNVHELAILLGAGGITGGIPWLKEYPKRLLVLFGTVILCFAGVHYLPISATPSHEAPLFSLREMFLAFLRIGSVLYGSGYVLLAFLRTDFVVRWHWLTAKQLLDSIVVGQITPGPVFTTATFIGYLLGGWQGALLATLGIFLPAFIFVAMSGPLIPKIRKSKIARSILDGVNTASLALMAQVTWELARVALKDGITIGIAGVSGLLIYRYKANTLWVLLGGGGVGLLFHSLKIG